MAESIVASVNSTCLDEVFYNGDAQELTLTFASGSTYSYAGVPADVAQGLVDAGSKGRYFQANIRGAYSFHKG